MTEKDYGVGEIIFYKTYSDGGAIFLVEVLENTSDRDTVRLKLKKLKLCNCEGDIGDEIINFFLGRQAEKTYELPMVGREYLSPMRCKILQGHLDKLRGRTEQRSRE